MIDTIIFDIGNVLAMADWKNVFGQIGISDDDIENVINATVRSTYWHEFDRGILPEQEIIAGCISLAPEYENEIMKVFAHPDIYVKVTDYAEKWVKEYKNKGFRVYILSNFPKRAFEAERDKFTFLDYADGAVVSYKVNMVKPDRDIFEYLEKKYNVIPQNSIFIDDLKENIDASISYGYNGIVFYNKNQADMEINRVCQNHQTKN